MDASELCGDELAHYYQQQIGVLRWAVELGRTNICTEVSMLALYTAAPRIGHFNAMLHISTFLHHHPRSKFVFDNGNLEIEATQDEDWSEFYPDAREEVPPNTPKAFGNAVTIVCNCDSDHAGDTISRCSRTGVLVSLTRAPVLWYSTFGSKFMDLKTSTDLVKVLRYKLRMMGIPLDVPAHKCVDNISVVHNSSKPESTLKKKSNSIAYHYVRENGAAKAIKIVYI
jgi:hypothetical protein